jgi:hypothetical protein
MTTATSKTEYFLFHSQFEVAIYRYLITNHREDMERIKAETMQRLEQHEVLRRLGLAGHMGSSLKEFFGDQAPINVSSIDGAFFDDSDIFEELLSDAIAKCNFGRIAAAYLAGVELPPYGPRKTSEELELAKS